MDRRKGRKLVWLAVRGSLLFLLLVWFVHSRLSAPSAQPPQADPNTFIGRLATQAGITEGQARKVLQQLGPAMAAEFKKGNQVQLPHLGKFRRAVVGDYSHNWLTAEMRFVPDSYIVEYEPSASIVHEMNSIGPPRLPRAATQTPLVAMPGR